MLGFKVKVLFESKSVFLAEDFFKSEPTLKITTLIYFRFMLVTFSCNGQVVGPVHFHMQQLYSRCFDFHVLIS